jgi:hypothetical protein
MRRLGPVLLFLSSLATAQSAVPTPGLVAPETEPQLSPQAAYDLASRPLDIVRRPVSNWSEVEQTALKVAVAEAKTACEARSPYQYQGEDRLSYARLCAFAQSWQQVQQSALGYLIAQSSATPAEKLTGFPNLSMAFDYEVQASLHLKNTANAFGTAQTMLRTVAYDDLASDAVNSTVLYVQLIQTDQAIALLAQRQPLLLAMLKTRGVPVDAKAAPVPDTGALLPSARPPMSIHDLYADAIQLPAMLQFDDKPEEAAKALAELEASLPANLSPDDTIPNAASRRQYMLLGSPLPPIAASASLLDLTSPAAPDLNRKTAGASALLLFPDWCAQCVAMDTLFNQATTSLAADGFHFYALLAQANPHPPAAPSTPVSKPTAKGPAKGTSLARSGAKGAASAAAKPESAHIEISVGSGPSSADQLVGTQTLIVPNELLDTFAATDFPLLVVTDGRGLVRNIGIAPENVLVEGGLIYQVAERVSQQWPVATAKVSAQY